MKSFNVLLATNLGAFEAFIFMASPVLGLRPIRAFLLDTLNVPNPAMVIGCPFFMALGMQENIEFTASCASFLVLTTLATSAIRSALFIISSFRKFNFFALLIGCFCRTDNIFGVYLCQSNENSKHAARHISDKRTQLLFFPDLYYRRVQVLYCWGTIPFPFHFSPKLQAPMSRSKFSCLVLQVIQRLAIGLAFSRSIAISVPQSSQIPYSPFSMSSRD